MKLLILPNINMVFIDAVAGNIDCSELTNCKKIIWNDSKGLVLYYDATVTKLLDNISDYNNIIQQHQALTATYDADQLAANTRTDVCDHAFNNFDYEWQFHSSDEVQIS